MDVHSEGVIYDNTPPTVGGIKVGSSLAYFVTSHIISVQWHGIEDEESGISTIEIGIGSNNFSADVIPFKEFEDNAEINVDGYFQDGHQYFAILKVTFIFSKYVCRIIPKCLTKKLKQLSEKLLI